MQDFIRDIIIAISIYEGFSIHYKFMVCINIFLFIKRSPIDNAHAKKMEKKQNESFPITLHRTLLFSRQKKKKKKKKKKRKRKRKKPYLFDTTCIHE